MGPALGLSAREERLQGQLGGYYDIPSENSAVRMPGTGVEIKERPGCYRRPSDPANSHLLIHSQIHS